GTYANRGQWPDINSQAVEVKLQLSPTIDLGLVLPSSAEPAPDTKNLRHCDVRYAVVYATLTGKDMLHVDDIVVSTGEDFFNEFRQFKGKGISAKLQIPLPKSFFEPEAP